jgi:hypothetical protein
MQQSKRLFKLFWPVRVRVKVPSFFRQIMSMTVAPLAGLFNLKLQNYATVKKRIKHLQFLQKARYLPPS